MFPGFMHRCGMLAGLVTALCTSQALADECIDVSIRGFLTPVCSDVYDNPSPTLPVARTVLAIHGFTETGDTWIPLKDAIFAQPGLRAMVERVITVNLPGRLDSPAAPTAPPAPDEDRFGNLLIEDYAQVVIQVIDGLAARGLAVDVVLGHSMGGLEIQSAQAQLLAAGSSLAAHGVSAAVLLAPVPNLLVDWATAVPVPANPPNEFTPELGAYYSFDPLTAQFFGFMRLADNQVLCYAGFGMPPCFGTVPPNFVGLEPAFATFQLGGPIPRPAAPEGAFHPNKGTALVVIGLEQDVLTPEIYQRPLYQHLVGAPIEVGYRRIDSDDSVHSMHIINPAALLQELTVLGGIF